jgi:hypothetical protein
MVLIGLLASLGVAATGLGDILDQAPVEPSFPLARIKQYYAIEVHHVAEKQHTEWTLN